MKVPMEGEETEDKAVGRIRGGWSTKLHAIVDGLGNPVAFLLSAENDHNSTYAAQLLEQVNISGTSVLLDRVYGTVSIQAYIGEHRADYVIPSKKYAFDPWPVD